MYFVAWSAYVVDPIYPFYTISARPASSPSWGCIIHRISLQYLYRFWVSPAIQMPFISPLRAHTPIHTCTYVYIWATYVHTEWGPDFALTLARFNAFSARSEDNSRATCGILKRVREMDMEEERKKDKVYKKISVYKAVGYNHAK